jgi:hypothetical protein
MSIDSINEEKLSARAIRDEDPLLLFHKDNNLKS